MSIGMVEFGLVNFGGDEDIWWLGVSLELWGDLLSDGRSFMYIILGSLLGSSYIHKFEF